MQPRGDAPRSRIAPKWYALLFVILAVVGLACSGGDKKDNDTPDKPNATSTYKGPTSLPYCHDGKDCYKDSQAEAYANRMAVATWDILVEEINANLSKHLRVSRPEMVFVNKGDRVKAWCRFTTGDDGFYVPYDKALTYCGSNLVHDPTMYIGPGLLNEFRHMGELVPGIVLAHEYTHHLQRWVNAPQPGLTRDIQLELKAEDQADCMSGYWIARVNAIRANAKQPIISQGQINKYVGWLDAHNKTRPYKKNERRDAITFGMKNGAKACADRYFPEKSIIEGP